MAIQFKYEGSGKTILFKDSMLLLPNSLRNLCEAFNILSSKGLFPFLLKDITYKGIFPAYKYWCGVTLEQYLELSKNFLGVNWSFKDEAIKYCNLDCKCTHEILTVFNKLIFTNFSQNIHSSLTLPSLAFRIFKSMFMPNLPDGVKIHQISGQVEREGFSGGATDAYIPHNRIGGFFSNLFKTLYYYDVNGLYPFVMANIPMPVGRVKPFEGNIRRVKPNASGVFYCNIIAPDLLHPILQKRIKTPDGIRTVAGTGTWTGWINTIEMDNAIKHNYQFQIIKGYEFDTAIIFKAYVEAMFALRNLYPKGHPMNYIAKLLQNSLYGKFGMDSQSQVIELYSLDSDAKLKEFHNFLEKSGKFIEDFTMITDSKGQEYVLLVRDNISNFTFADETDNYHSSDVNVAIASTITAGGRAWMSLIKNNPLFNLYYSDTDSGVLDAPLPSEMVGDKLGHFKLEHTISRAVFLAPKVYAFITSKGEEVIKVKGLTPSALSGFHFKDLEALLSKDSSKEFTQEKWFKSISEGKITVKDVAYTLKTTSNKRESIYINGTFEATKPYNYNEIENKIIFPHQSKYKGMWCSRRSCNFS